MKPHSPITSITQLKKLSSQKPIDAFITLKGGLVSKKTIRWMTKKKRFNILNHIDNTRQSLSEDELNDSSITNIGKAIRMNSLVIALS